MKVQYEIDPHNRLVVTGQEKAKRPKGPAQMRRLRRVIDGRFRVSRANSLSYHIKAPAGLLPGPSADYARWDGAVSAPRRLRRPHQVKLRGRWSLDGRHNLRFTLDKWRRRTFGDSLTITGDIIDVKKNALLFAVTTRTKERVKTTYILKLRGSWQADRANRITFTAKREGRRNDILTFGGAWRIKKQKIAYQYRRRGLIGKKGAKNTLTFNGFWDISKRNRLSYIIDISGRSHFDFITSLARLSARAIRYKIGIGIRGRPGRHNGRVYRLVTLTGAWRIKKNVGLFFDAGWSDGRPRAILFGADVKLARNNRIRFRLRNERGRRLGLDVVLSRRFLKGDGNIFIRALKGRREATIFAGAAWRW